MGVYALAIKYIFCFFSYFMLINPLRANPENWSNTPKQFVGCCPQIVWVCLTFRGVGV